MSKIRDFDGSNSWYAELTEEMAAELEARGHCTGRYQNIAGQLCLLGAGRMAQAGYIYTLQFGVKQEERLPYMNLFDVDENTSVALGGAMFDVVGFNDGDDGLGFGAPLDQQTAIEFCHES